MEEHIKREYERWLDRADASLAEELRAMTEENISDAFYRNLAFGTGGLRGILGAGTNRMNVHTVARASQGLADYVKKHFAPEMRRIAISYDSRILSAEFARVAAGVFAANGLAVWLYDTLMPTPCLSFAVRELHCAAGVMITASHNPARYNGYKVYGPDGCQITLAAAEEILAEIEAADVFDGVTIMSFDEGDKAGAIRYIPQDILTAYLDAVKECSLLSDASVARSMSIVYTPLNGTGLYPVLRALHEAGFENIFVVPEQEKPDGHFPTCPKPNPEERKALTLAIRYARERGAALVLATDPDCDRVGIAVRDRTGDYRLLSGNEVGLLLLNYICARRTENGTMPKGPVLIKTIVTTDLAEKIASHYGLRTINVLTGFKFIGEQIGVLEAQGKADSYVFGFEESYGYLSGSYVRDKDAVNGSLLICDMAAYYAAHDESLLERLEALYREYGYCLNTLHSYEFPGESGMAAMQRVMERLRGNVPQLGGHVVAQRLDYADGLDGLPKADALKFILEDDSVVVVRPSGTEPKLKAYFSISAKDAAEAEKSEDIFATDLSATVEGRWQDVTCQ